MAFVLLGKKMEETTKIPMIRNTSIKKKDHRHLVSMGILSLLTGPIGIILGIAVSLNSKKIIRRTKGKNAYAKIGLCLGITGTILSIVITSIMISSILFGGSPFDGRNIVSTQVNKTISESVNLDDDSIQKLYDSYNSALARGGSNDYLFRMGISKEEFKKILTDGISYSIGDVNIDGDTATVNVTITSGKMYSITEHTMDIISNMNIVDLNSDNGFEKIGSELVKSYKDIDQENTEFVVTLKRNYGIWFVENSKNYLLYKIFF